MDELQRDLALHIHGELWDQCGGGYGVAEDYDPQTGWLPWIDHTGGLNLALMASSIIAFIDGWRQHHD
jgi:hypothetical protein